MLGIKLHWSSVLLGKGHGQASQSNAPLVMAGLRNTSTSTLLCEAATPAPTPWPSPTIMVNGRRMQPSFCASWPKGSLCTTPGRAPDRGLPWGDELDQAFEQSYRQATIRKASAEQLTMMLLQSEACRVSQHGTITLESGGAIANRSNRYFHADLAEYVGQKVVARFDPQRLHEAVVVTTLNGLHICDAGAWRKSRSAIPSKPASTSASALSSSNRTRLPRWPSKACQPSKLPPCCPASQTKKHPKPKWWKWCARSATAMPRWPCNRWPRTPHTQQSTRTRHRL